MPDEKKLIIGAKLFDSLQQLYEGADGVLTILRVGDKQTIRLTKELNTEKVDDVCEDLLADYNDLTE